MFNEINLSWMAGLLEGEGCFMSKDNKYPIVTIALTDLDVLEKAKSIFGGKIYELKKRKVHWKDAWTWTLRGENAYLLMMQIRNYMGDRRKNKIDECMANYNKYLHGKDIKEQAVYDNRRKMENLHSSGITHKQIGEKMGFARSYVTHVLNGRYD